MNLKQYPILPELISDLNRQIAVCTSSTLSQQNIKRFEIYDLSAINTARSIR